MRENDEPFDLRCMYARTTRAGRNAMHCALSSSCPLFLVLSSLRRGSGMAQGEGEKTKRLPSSTADAV